MMPRPEPFAPHLEVHICPCQEAEDSREPMTTAQFENLLPLQSIGREFQGEPSKKSHYNSQVDPLSLVRQEPNPHTSRPPWVCDELRDSASSLNTVHKARLMSMEPSQSLNPPAYHVDAIMHVVRAPPSPKRLLPFSFMMLHHASFKHIQEGVLPIRHSPS